MTIKPVNIANLESLLTRIWNGELEHKQDTFFCDTACCVAGWDVALNHPDDYASYSQGVESAELDKAFSDPFTWSMLNNDLDYDEAALLFNADSTKYLQQKTLEAIKAGRRLGELPEGVGVDAEDPQSDHYDSGSVMLLVFSEEERRELIEFLGDLDESKIQVLIDEIIL